MNRRWWERRKRATDDCRTLGGRAGAKASLTAADYTDSVDSKKSPLGPLSPVSHLPPPAKADRYIRINIGIRTYDRNASAEGGAGLGRVKAR